MKVVVQFIGLLLVTGLLHAQPVAKKLAEAVRLLESDEQMKSGLLALHVVDQKTGVAVYERNARIGLQVASTQKVITATTALELLGSSYTYKTAFAYDGKVDGGRLNGNFYVIGSGDPTLGSWRFGKTKEDIVLEHFAAGLGTLGIKNVTGGLLVYDGNWSSQTTPGGWVWDDIGNYYGAGVSAVNWRENQYEIKLRSGSPGSAATIAGTYPPISNLQLINEVIAGKAGSGDNAFIYTAPYSDRAFIRGTIPPNQSSFIIKGAFTNPGLQMGISLISVMRREGVSVGNVGAFHGSNKDWKLPSSYNTIATHTSPAISEMMPLFLQKSINLYGEAFLKTIAVEKKDEGTFEAGIGVIKAFWKNNGIEPHAMNIADGSGLSMQSRVTASTLTKVMQYARTRPWFNTFNAALPELNGIKMKSGTITGIKSFTGYVNGYTFAIIINNYSGSSAEITRKLYKVLDLLKR